MGRVTGLLTQPSSHHYVARCDDEPMASRRTTYTTEELEDLAAGLGRLLGAIEKGTLEADSGTIAGLEGARAAIQALAEGQSL